MHCMHTVLLRGDVRPGAHIMMHEHLHFKSESKATVRDEQESRKRGAEPRNPNHEQEYTRASRTWFQTNKNLSSTRAKGEPKDTWPGLCLRKFYLPRTQNWLLFWDLQIFFISSLWNVWHGYKETCFIWIYYDAFCLKGNVIFPIPLCKLLELYKWAHIFQTTYFKVLFCCLN